LVFPCVAFYSSTIPCSDRNMNLLIVLIRDACNPAETHQ
jgi:hypothetical protein